MSIEPITSVEMLINAIVENAGTTEITAVSRIELFLTDILMGRVSEIPPITRIEMYLAAISGADVDLPDPITRVEMFLAKIAGQDVEPPEPISRLEMFLADWADHGGIYEVTVSGTSPLILAAAMPHALQSLTRYGLCVQNGTPTPDAYVDILCNNGALKYSANMANVNEQTARVGYYINAQGAVLADQYNWFYQEYINVKPSTTYTLSMSSPVYYVTISEYSTAEDSGFIVRKNGTTGGNRTLTITTGETTNFVRFGANLNRVAVSMDMVLAINWMLNIGTAMDFQPYVEGGIYAGGTHPGQNLVDLTAVTDDYYYDQNGVYTALANARLTDYIPVKSGQKYTIYVKAQRAGVAANVRCNLFDFAKVWKSQSTFAVNSGSEDVGVITPSEDGYLRISANYAGTGAKADWSTLQIVRGEYTLATMPPYEPYTEVPYLPEVLTVSGANLFNASSYTEINAYVNANTGVLTAGSPGSMTQYCAVIPCKANTLYNIAGQGTSAWGAFPSDSIGTTATAFTKGGNLTTGANDRFLIGLVRANGDSIDYRNTLVVQEPQTASVPMLLGVGNYKDAAELIQGIKTGKIGVKVFDGTETFTVSSSGAMITAIPDVAIGAENTPMNTHFALETSPTSIAVGTQRFGASGTKIYSANYYMKHPTITTSADFKAWLGALFVAGTPDILVYPRATETTEQTAPQHLVTHKGTNVVEVTANVSPVALDAVYASDTPAE